MLKRFSLFLLLLAACTARGSDISRDAVFGHAKTLSGDAYEGRGAGTAGAVAASAYVADEFRKIGLTPAGDAGGYFQSFAWKDRRCRNVVGAVKGRRTDRAIVVGAHFDHLGAHGGEIFHGADDNASGTAALIEIARALSRTTPENSIVFAAFSGEETGILGSQHFVKNLPALGGDPVRVPAMVNMDMVGRLRDDTLVVQGADTSPAFRPILESVAGPKLTLLGGGSGRSDHTAFYFHDIPVLFFFTGAHEDYHKPGDVADRLNADGMAKVANFVSRVVGKLAALAEPPAFVRVQDMASMSDSSSRPMVRLGTMPDYGFEGPGVQLSGVHGDSPAAKAGWREGDIVEMLDGRETTTVQAYSNLLRELTAGVPVRFRLSRDGKPVEGTITPEPGRAAAQEPFHWAPKVDVVEGEKRFKWIRQLTSDGTHAEAYFAPDGKKLILMGLRKGDPADQIYSMDLESGTLKRLSTGKGKST